MSVQLNPRLRFDTFVVGAANRLAAAAGRTVASTPGTVYNPLFIYSAPGLGKTHLLMAIGQAAREISPQISVEYLTLDDFVEAFHAAVGAGQGDAYRRRFAELDLLLVDDVQFLSHRREMQAELLRLVNALQMANRQIVLASDRPPDEIEALDERLIQRFAGGLVVDIGAPDYETRVAILRRLSEERRVALGEGVLEQVAALRPGSVRELIGSLNRLIAFQAVSEEPLEAGRVRALLGGEAERADAPQGGEPPAVAARRAPAAAPDEFSAFLSEIATTVAQQVEVWRTRVAEAILRWEGEGFRTQRLSALLDQEAPSDPEAVIREYEADVERLRLLESEAVELDAALAGSPAFRNPDNLAAAQALVERAREGRTPPPGPAPIWKLEELVEGNANRVALGAVRAVLESPGARYNPLVLVGGGGTGKTHLLHGLGNALAARPGAVVACLGAQEFVSDLIEAIEREAVALWRARYRRVTALLLDDFHLLGGKDRTQEELFWLFNALAEGGRQMVFTAAVPLAELEGIESRLVTRLEGGLVVELGPPEREVRHAVIERTLAARAGAADAELAEYLASRPADSVRAVYGLVQRVLNAAEARDHAPSAALARELFEGGPAGAGRRPGRPGGVVVPPGGGARSREKMIWEWPEAADRIVEELR